MVVTDGMACMGAVAFITILVFDIRFAWRRDWELLFPSLAIGCVLLILSIMYVIWHPSPAHGTPSEMTAILLLLFIPVMALALAIMISLGVWRWWTRPPEEETL